MPLAVFAPQRIRSVNEMQNCRVADTPKLPRQGMHCLVGPSPQASQWQPCEVRSDADVVAATHPQSTPILPVAVAIDHRPTLPPTYRHMVQPVFDLDAQCPSHAV